MSSSRIISKLSSPELAALLDDNERQEGCLKLALLELVTLGRFDITHVDRCFLGMAIGKTNLLVPKEVDESSGTDCLHVVDRQIRSRCHGYGKDKIHGITIKNLAYQVIRDYEDTGGFRRSIVLPLLKRNSLFQLEDYKHHRFFTGSRWVRTEMGLILEATTRDVFALAKEQVWAWRLQHNYMSDHDWPVSPAAMILVIRQSGSMLIDYLNDPGIVKAIDTTSNDDRTSIFKSPGLAALKRFYSMYTAINSGVNAGSNKRSSELDNSQ